MYPHELLHMLVAALWKFLNMMQELVLLSMVNTRYITADMIAAFQAGSFVDFDIFSLVVSLFPPEYQGMSDYNRIEDNAQYHPTLAGKMFLSNVWSHLLFTACALLGFVAFSILGRKFAYFRKRSEAFAFCGAIDCVQSCAIDVFLSAAVQLRYVPSEYHSPVVLSERQHYLHAQLYRGLHCTR